jgi:hypothetical protein
MAPGPASTCRVTIFGFFPPALSINDIGVVVGSYSQGNTQGFLWQSGINPATLRFRPELFIKLANIDEPIRD